MTKEQPGQWPSWPAGSAGTVMVDVLVETLSVDELFLLVHGGETEFRVSRLYCSPFGRRHKSSQRRWSAAPTAGVRMARRRNAAAVCPAARPSACPPGAPAEKVQRGAVEQGLRHHPLAAQ